MNLMEKYLRKLEGNRDTLTPVKENASPLPKDKARPSGEIFEEKFNDLAAILSRYALTDDDIKAQSPQRFKRLLMKWIQHGLKRIWGDSRRL